MTTLPPNSLILNMMIFIIMSLFMMTIKSISVMCLMLFIHTINVSTMISLTNPSFTPLPFIIFLTIIGGLMIIFLYFTSMMSNMKMTSTSISPMNLYMLITALILLIMMMKALPANLITIKMNSLFKNNFNNMTIILIIFLTLILMLTIKIYSKANSPFRRKLKIWEKEKNF